MVALLVLAVSLTVLLENHSYSIRLSGIARNITIASQLARSKMVDLELAAETDDLRLGSDDGDFGEDFANFRWSSEVEEETLELNVLPMMPQPIPVTGKRLILWIYWTEGSMEKNVKLENFIPGPISQAAAPAAGLLQ
jgi:hypothetical protein